MTNPVKNPKSSGPFPSGSAFADSASLSPPQIAESPADSPPKTAKPRARLRKGQTAKLAAYAGGGKPPYINTLVLTDCRNDEQSAYGALCFTDPGGRAEPRGFEDAVLSAPAESAPCLTDFASLSAIVLHFSPAAAGKSAARPKGKAQAQSQAKTVIFRRV